MKLAIVGVTGLVGSVILKVLEEHKLAIDELVPVASIKSIGKKILFNNKEWNVVSVEEAISKKPDIAIFSAGATASKQYAPLFAAVGTTVIDNSSAWRMDDKIKLIVPEVNANILTSQDKIIAYPNCSTIQLVVALAPLHAKYRIKRIVVSTYQSVTGSGVKGVLQLENERKKIAGEMAYPHPIDFNCIPHGGTFDNNGYTIEETKLVNETRKIIGDNAIQLTATVVRVPVLGGHSEAVNVEFHNDFDLEEIKEMFRALPGIALQDNPSENYYPMPLFAQGKDEVFIGRIRRDFSIPNALNLWVVSDNLRKGAATNAVQIAEYLITMKLI